MRFLRNTRKKAGLAPGTLVHIGEKKTDQVRITLTQLGPDNVEEKEIRSIEDVHLKDETGSGKAVGTWPVSAKPIRYFLTMYMITWFKRWISPNRSGIS